MEKTKGSDNVPEKRFSTGVISATIWKNAGKGRTGEPVEYRTITLQRRYKDKNEQWQSTNSLRINDLPKAILVLNKAYEHLVLRENNEVSSESPSVEEDVFEEIVM